MECPRVCLAFSQWELCVPSDQCYALSSVCALEPSFRTPRWLAVLTKEMACSSHVGVAKRLMVTVTSVQQALIQTGARSCICVHTYTHTCIPRKHIHVYTHIHAPTREHNLYLFMCPYMQMYTHNVYTYAHVHVSRYIHTPVSVICTCSVMNTYEHTHVY